MLKRKHLFVLFLIVPVLLLVLVAAQWYWIRNTYRLREISLDERMDRAVHNAASAIDNQVFSWNLYSRAYLRKGQGFMILQDDQLAGGPGDTMTMFNAFPYPDSPDTCFYRTNTSYFDRPTLVDINIRIENLDSQNLSEIPFQKQAFSNISADNYKSLLDDTALFARQLAGIDTLLRKAMLEEGLDTTCSFAVTRHNEPILGKGPATMNDLQKSPFHATLFATRPFVQPYHLYVLKTNKDATILSSMTTLISLSALLVLGICGLFIYFFAIVLRQKRLSEMKTDFINNMTHEFMTPVTNIGLAIETLERSRQDEHSRKHILSLIAHENNHLRDNVNKVLQVAVMDRGAYDTQTAAFDLKELLERVIKSFELVLLQAGGTLALHADDEELVIHADETHAINLFSNLLDNCIKYRSPGRPLRIYITVRKNGKRIRVSIEDNGNGMDNSIQQRAFIKFYRGGNGNLHDVKGFGLGLSYVKAIADAYQWEVSLKSTPGKGTMTEISIK